MMWSDQSELPALKYISDETYDSKVSLTSERARDQSKKSTEPTNIPLFTDSMVMLSSSDTLNEHGCERRTDSDCSTDYSGSQLPSKTTAFSYYDSPTSEKLSVVSLDSLDSGETECLDEESEYCVTIVSQFLRHVSNDINGEGIRKLQSQPSQAKYIISAKDAKKAIYCGAVARKIKSCPEAARLSTLADYDADQLRQSAPQPLKRRSIFRQNEHVRTHSVQSSVDCYYTAETATTGSAADSLQTAVETMQFRDIEGTLDRSNGTLIYATTVDRADKQGITTYSVVGGSISFKGQYRRSVDRKLCRTCSLDGLKYNPACPLQRKAYDSFDELVVM